MVDDASLLRSLAETIAIPLSRTDAIKWPIRSGLAVGGVLPVYAVEYVGQLHRLMTSVPKEKWTFGFTSALSIWKVSHHVINGLEQSSFTKGSIADSVLLMAKMINHLEGNATQSGRHCIMPEHEISNLAQMIDPVRSNELYAELMSLLWGYSDALLFQCRELCAEYHGPYRLSDDIQLIVLDIKNLDVIASVIWEEMFQPIGAEHIRVCRLIPSGCSISVDAYNNIDVTKGSLWSSNAGFVLVDGSPLELSEALEFRSKIIERFTKQVTIVNGLSTSQLCEAYVKLFWLRKRGMARLLGEEWMPAAQIFTDASEWSKSLDKYTPHVIASAEELATRFDYSPYLNPRTSKSVSAQVFGYG